ncbi:Hypothetical protein, putative [Bodo saltans]|uniref:Uncharacterized protein n=1 Tax=Bodo saltans TaxID=75058 RepID=A0A0S4J8N4_BODSA|nr:Hypothetical protein, putative [Bodo saltans]|eukprot:CUG86546.1 Hypothetical protein, putative [Bodo saltans]
MNKSAAGGSYSSSGGNGDASAASSSGGGGVLRGTALLQWFDALAAPAGISGGDSSQHALPPLQKASQLLTPLALHVGSELLDAFGVSYSTFFNPTLQLAADPTLCPLSGDRTIWADYVFSPMCSESSRRLRELHAVVSHKLLPLFDAVVTALHPVVYTLQAIVAESDVGSIVAQENIDTLSPQLNGLVAARTLLAKEFDATRQDEHAVRTCLSQFQRSRGDVGAISLLQLTTSSSKVRAKSEPHHSSPGKSPRGHPSNNLAVTTLHSPGSSSALQQTAAANSSNNTNSATAAHRLSTEFQEATVATASFVQLLCAIATAPLDAEVVANRMVTYFDVPITDADVDTISCLYASFAAISKRVNEEHWARAEHSARRTLDHIKEAVCTAVQFAKKDKSVMANLMTTVDDVVGRTPRHLRLPLRTPPRLPVIICRHCLQALEQAPSPQQQRIGTTASSRPTPRAPSPQQHRALSNTTSAPDKQPMQQRARSTSLSRGANPSGSGEAVGGAVHPHQHSHEVSMRSSSPRVRSRRERPVNVRQQLDRLLEEFLTTWKNRIPSNFDRTDPATNIFCFGAKKIELSAVDNFIVVKVGGGYLLLVEYCEKYAAMEMRRWNLHLEKTAVASAGGPAYRRSISPGTAGSFGLIYTQSNGVGSATTTTGLRASSASRQASTPRTTTPLRASTTTAQRLLSARSPNA